MRLVSLFMGVVLSGAAVGCSGSVVCGPDQPGCLRVLFLGNSYTYANDLPVTFSRLAGSGGHAVEVALVANGGETLAQHAGSAEDEARLQDGEWDYVVLQEQSEVPAVDAARPSMASAVGTLADRVRAAGGTPLLLETWAHRDGLPDYGLTTYDAMQSAIDDGYARVGSATNVRVVPVGEAWARAMEADPTLKLWQPDGSHPSAAGTYLAALVLYRALFSDDPARLDTSPGAPAPNVARELAAAAGQSMVK